MNSKDGLSRLALLAPMFFLVACSGSDRHVLDRASDNSAPPTASPPQPVTINSADPESLAFLTQATFGATVADIKALEEVGQSEWVLSQFAEPPIYYLPTVLAKLPNGDLLDANGNYIRGAENLAVASFWETAITGKDQLRQRMAYALSQILVTSGGKDSGLQAEPHIQAAYMDVLVKHAFGNYRDLLEDVTYSVAMARYLTYLRSLKGDPQIARLPDENYARELMQLFTIGLIELNHDGTPKLNAGKPIETYTNSDITGLARVFTGLGLNGRTIFSAAKDLAPDANYTPLKVFPEWHSGLEKSFLGTTIPAGTDAETSIDKALDTLFHHPNVAPFIGRQLIQRFVTSNPRPSYVARVATAFETGLYTLPNGASVGDGRRGDLQATIAAILFDACARDGAARREPDFGKLREPALRFTHWARAFAVNSAHALEPWSLRNSSRSDALNQHPFDAPSVFNFYRPGYVPPGTGAAEAGLVAPEFQLVNSVSIVGYVNFMSRFIFSYESGANEASPPTFQPDYSREIALGHNPSELVEHLDAFLANGHLSRASEQRIAIILSDLPVNSATREKDLERRVELAVLLVMTSPEYLIQR